MASSKALVGWVAARLSKMKTAPAPASPSSRPSRGPNLAKAKILAKYNTVSQGDRLHDGTKSAQAVREKEERDHFAVT
jgi:hypothetical protein